MSKIAIHHAGGRWGNRSFPILPRFEDDFVVVFYDADVDAIDGIHGACAGQKAELIILPYCLAAAEAEAELQIYSNPGLTSLRPLGTMLETRYLHLFGVDFDFDDAGARLLERRPVRTVALDSVLERAGDPIPAPDFLSLDVQGCEYEVLAGAENALRNAVCGLIVEVEFAEMYAGQKRFQDVHDFLHQRGFDFVRFISIGEASGPVAPLGFRLGGYQSWADALFLKRPETLDGTADEGERLGKLCFMAVVFGNLELAIDCVRRIRLLPASDSPPGRSILGYQQFIKDLGPTFDRTEKVYPPVFSKILPEHRMLDYARATNSELWPEIFECLKEFDRTYLSHLDDLQKNEDTEIEALLRRHDFTEQADRLNFTRRHQAHGIMQAIRAAQGTS